MRGLYGPLQQLKSVVEEQNSGIERQLFIVTVGDDDSGKAGMAFSHAAHSVAVGNEVLIFLVLDGTKWAYDGYGEDYKHPCFENPRMHLQNCIELGAKVVACSTCSRIYDSSGIGVLIEDIEIGGFSDVQDFVNEPCCSITY